MQEIWTGNLINNERIIGIFSLSFTDKVKMIEPMRLDFFQKVPKCRLFFEENYRKGSLCFGDCLRGDVLET